MDFFVGEGDFDRWMPKRGLSLVVDPEGEPGGEVSVDSSLAASFLCSELLLGIT